MKEESKFRKAMKRYGPAVLGFGIGISGVLLLANKKKQDGLTYLPAHPELLQKLIDEPDGGIGWVGTRIILFNTENSALK